MGDADLEATIDSLSAKLADLDLNDDERRVLFAALMPNDEVEGFAYDMGGGTRIQDVPVPIDLPGVLDESVSEIARFRAVLGGRLLGTVDGSSLPGTRFRC